MTPRLEGRVRDWFAEPYRTRLDSFPATTAQFGLDPSVEPAFQRSIGDEPLRLLGRVAVSDRPWTEVVTADWSMADEVLAGVYPVAYPEGASGWQEVKWTDHRPSAGVLTTNGLWWRYGSTEENYNRGRANAVSRILLCQDFLVRPVTFPRSSVVVDAAALLDQTRTNEACVSCHVSVDPLGSYLFGFSYGDVAFVSPDYDPSSELSWQSGTGLAPSYFGEPGDDLTDLGRQIAADPRFPACTTEQVFEALVGRRHEDSDLDPPDGPPRGLPLVGPPPQGPREVDHPGSALPRGPRGLGARGQREDAERRAARQRRRRPHGLPLELLRL